MSLPAYSIDTPEARNALSAAVAGRGGVTTKAEAKGVCDLLGLAPGDPYRAIALDTEERA